MKKVSVKSKLTLTTTFLSMAIMLCCFANQASARVYTFQGVAKPFLTTTLPYGYNDDYRGIVQWTALPGQIIKGPIYDVSGKVVKPGDVIIQLDTAYREAIVKTKEDAIKIAEANLEWTKAQFERYKTLTKTRATSLQQFQQSKNDYLEAIATLDSAKADLISAQALFNLTTYRAQFDGIIDKVLMPCGLLAGEPLTITLSQIEPIAIDVKMPRALARKINPSTRVKIYPCDSDKPVGRLTGESILTDTGIKFFADNWTHPPKNKNLPIVRKVGTVIRMDLSIKQPLDLSVHESAIKKDSKGTYVWYVTNGKDAQAGAGVPDVLNVKKVYVKVGTLMHKIDNHWVFIQLKDPGILKQYDLVVIDIPKDFKGGKVYWDRDKLLFMPGDPLKVEITLND